MFYSTIRYLLNNMNFITTLLLKKYKPKLIVVFGAYGRDESRRAIHAVLAAHTTVYSASAGSFTKEFRNYTGGLATGLKALFKKSAFPHVIVVDSSTDNKEYKKLREILGIDLAIVMPLGDIPSFSDLFSGPGPLSPQILKEIRAARRAILCGDDESLVDIAAELIRKPIMFGFDEANDIRIESANPELLIKRRAHGRTHVKVDHDGNFIPFSIPSSFGKRNIYAAGAALGVSVPYDINFISAAQDLQKYTSPANAFHLSSGIRSTALITVTKNVTPYAAREAIELIGRFRETGSIARSVLVLSDIILDKEGETEGLHRYLGELAAHNADVLILIGERVIFSEEEAQKHGMSAENIFRFHDVGDAALKTQEILERMDGVLILGSESIDLKKIIDEIRVR